MGRRKKEKKSGKDSKRSKRRRVEDDEEELVESSEDAAEEEDEESLDDEGERRRGGASRFEDVADDGSDESESEVKEEEEDAPTKEELEHFARAERRRKEERQRGEDLLSRMERRAKEEEDAGDDVEIAGSEVSEQDDEHAFAVPKDTLGAAAQQGLYPTIADPKLFMVRVKPGFARALCGQILYKGLVKAARGEDMMVLSVFCRDHIPDYLYIEAHRQAHVENALMGLQGVYRSKIRLIPLPEMPNTLAVVRDVNEVVPGCWGRFRYGGHKGDLCRIVAIDDDKATYTVHVIPRIDWAKFHSADAPTRGGSGAFRTAVGRARGRQVPRFFSDEDWKKAGDDVGEYRSMKEFVDQQALEAPTEEERALAARGVLFVRGRYFSAQGHEEKTVRQAQIFTDQKMVDASTDEIEGFCRGVLPTADQQLAALLRTREIDFRNGDQIRITKGELLGTLGTIREVYNDATGTKFRVEPKFSAAHGPVDPSEWIPVTKEMISKVITIGQHVKILVGAHRGQTGMVVSATTEKERGKDRSRRDRVRVFSDVCQQEVELFMSDVALTREMSRGVPQYGGYELMELVRLRSGAAGVLLKIQDGHFRILCDQGDSGMYSHGDILEVISSSRQSERRKGRRQSTIDRFDNEVCKEDVVQVINNTSPWSGVIANVKHIWQDAVWLQSSACVENMGLFVCRNTDLRQLGGDTHRRERDEEYFEEKKSAVVRKREDDDVAEAQPKKRSRRDPNSLAGERVRVVKGYYKGYLGIVKQLHLGQATIELHTGEKQITVPVTWIRAIDMNDTLATVEQQQRRRTKLLSMSKADKDGGAADALDVRHVRAGSVAQTAVSDTWQGSVLSDMRSLTGSRRQQSAADPHEHGFRVGLPEKPMSRSGGSVSGSRGTARGAGRATPSPDTAAPFWRAPSTASGARYDDRRPVTGGTHWMFPEALCLVAPGIGSEPSLVGRVVGIAPRALQTGKPGHISVRLPNSPAVVDVARGHLRQVMVTAAHTGSKVIVMQRGMPHFAGVFLGLEGDHAMVSPFDGEEAEEELGHYELPSVVVLAGD